MNFTELDKIEVKKTKSSMTISSYNTNQADNFKRLLAMGVINGGNINSIRQVLQGGLSPELNFDIFKNLQNKFNNMLYEAIKEIERVEKLQGIKTETHSFS